jgi:hypothetical protein
MRGSNAHACTSSVSGVVAGGRGPHLGPAQPRNHTQKVEDSHVARARLVFA